MLKNIRTLRYDVPFDVNDDVIFLFTFYKHRRTDEQTFAADRCQIPVRRPNYG